VKVEAKVRDELGLGRAEIVTPRALVNEVIRLADPNAVPGRDVVIPGGREDLVETWVRARLSGTATTPTERLALARQIAPDPGLNYDFKFQRGATARYRGISRFQAKVSEEAAERFSDSPPVPD
jgi:hypothetical protein